MLEGRRGAAKSGLGARLQRGGRSTLGAATFVDELGLVVGVAVMSLPQLGREGGEIRGGANPHWAVGGSQGMYGRFFLPA